VALRNVRVVDAILLILQAAIIVVLITFLERRGRLQNESSTRKFNPEVSES
jgi:hypothetical protein